MQLLGEVVGFADLADRLLLGLDPVDVVVLGDEDLLEQRAGGVVAGGDAGGDAVVEALDRLVLELEIELELLGHRLADAHRVEALHVGDAVEEQDPLDDLVGVLHLVDRLVAGVLGEPLVAPVARTSWRG